MSKRLLKMIGGTLASLILLASPARAALLSGRTSIFGVLRPTGQVLQAFDPLWDKKESPFSNPDFATEIMLSPAPWLEIGPGLMVFSNKRLPVLRRGFDGQPLAARRTILFSNRFAPMGVLAFRKRINRWLTVGAGLRMGYIKFQADDTIADPLSSPVSMTSFEVEGLVIHTPLRFDFKFKERRHHYFATGLEVAYLYHKPAILNVSNLPPPSLGNTINFSGFTLGLTFSARMNLEPYDLVPVHK